MDLKHKYTLSVSPRPHQQITLCLGAFLMLLLPRGRQEANTIKHISETKIHTGESKYMSRTKSREFNTSLPPQQTPAPTIRNSPAVCGGDVGTLSDPKSIYMVLYFPFFAPQEEFPELTLRRLKPPLLPPPQRFILCIDCLCVSVLSVRLDSTRTPDGQEAKRYTMVFLLKMCSCILLGSVLCVCVNFIITSTSYNYRIRHLCCM